jgi:ferredoxin
MPKAKIEFDRDTCIGCGACNAQSDNWEMEEDSGQDELKAKPKCLDVSEDDYDHNKEAEDVCPVQCIKIVDEA